MITSETKQRSYLPIKNLFVKNKVLVSILDKNGILVSKSYCDETKIQLNSSNLESGTYYWKAFSNNVEIASGKFIVEDR